MIHIKKASPLEGYKMKVIFTSGEEGIADLSELVTKGVFQKIQNFKEFKTFEVKDTIIWDNGNLDIAPEFIYFRTFQNKPELQNLFKKWGYLDRYPEKN